MSEHDIPDYPGNSNKSKSDPQPQQPQQPEKKKESSLMEDIVIGSVADVFNYTVFKVLVPSFKRIVWDIGMNSLAIILTGKPTDKMAHPDFGEPNVQPDNSRSPTTNYNSIFDYGRKPIGSSYDVRSRRSVDNVVVESEERAKKIVRDLWEIMDRYKCVSLADFYSAAGLTVQYTDRAWGWREFPGRSLDYKRVEDGWQIVIPNPQIL